MGRKARKLKDLMLKSDNRICADCGAPDPKWASANIGVFLCLKCGDVHRALGPDVSKVLSVTLDDWSDSDIDSMLEIGGNSYANSIYESFLPKDHPKPKMDSTMEYRTKFIRAKYETQDFLKPSLRITSKGSFDATNAVKSVTSSISSASGKHVADDTREFVGELNITVVRGIQLAVRDMLTSDPYVVLTLGEQKAQTTVKPSDLNPVWNEVLKISIPRNYGPLKLEVYDHDTFSADDIMGEAEIDLQPMITAVMAFGDPSRVGDMQIGRWFMTKDNALVKDSTVNVVSGKLVLEENTPTAEPTEAKAPVARQAALKARTASHRGVHGATFFCTRYISTGKWMDSGQKVKAPSSPTTWLK
uniref:ZAC n=2 Tax=Oryza nivara TaxID=4536 RepID=A0A0E0GCF8_ORYNI